MPVIYDGKKIIPAPFMSIRKDTLAAGNGMERLGGTISIVLKGKLTVAKGSPNSEGTFWTASDYPPDEVITNDERLASILAKQAALRGLFSTDGKTFEVQPYDGSQPTKFNPRIKSVEFAEGNWVETCDYTVTMEADDPTEAGDYILDASEEWNIEPSDDRVVSYRLTHSCSATGKKRFDENGDVVATGWENARLYVLNKIGLGLSAARMAAPDVLDADALQAFNYVRTQQLNEYAGTFQVTETWLCYDPNGVAPAIEEFTVTTRTDDGGRTSVNIEGQLQGLEVRNNTHALVSTRYANALSKYGSTTAPNMLARAQNLSGVLLNPVTLSTQVGVNQTTGVISFSAEYNDRPLPDVIGARSQSITVSNNNAADVFATIPVLGRALGPVLQDIGTVTAKKRSINIEIVMPAMSVVYTPSAPNTDGIIGSLMPVADQVFTDQDEESWNPYTGRYTRTTSFTWQ